MSRCHLSSPKAWQENPAGRGRREMLAMAHPPPCCSQAGQRGLAGLSSPPMAPAPALGGERCRAVCRHAVMSCGTQALESRGLWWGQTARNTSPPPGWFLLALLPVSDRVSFRPCWILSSERQPQAAAVLPRLMLCRLGTALESWALDGAVH